MCSIKTERLDVLTANLHGDLSKKTDALLDVSLASFPKNSMLGGLRGSDFIFEIHTESYGNYRIVIQRAEA